METHLLSCQQHKNSQSVDINDYVVSKQEKDAVEAFDQRNRRKRPLNKKQPLAHSVANGS